MFSSVLFIGTLDALGVVGRLTASTIVCQFITALELERAEDMEQEVKDVRNLGAGSGLIRRESQREKTPLLQRECHARATEGSRTRS